MKTGLQQKRGHTAELLIVLGKLVAQQGNTSEAIANLEEAGQLAKPVAHPYSLETPPNLGEGCRPGGHLFDLSDEQLIRESD